MTHVYDRLPARNFSIEWEGPGRPRQPIALESLRVIDDGAYPVPAITATASGDGSGRVGVVVDARGHAIDSTTLFLGQLQLAKSRGPGLVYEGPLPRGSNTFWCRVIFDSSRSVDSAPAVLNVTGKPVEGGWTVRNVSDSKASAGLWQTGPQSFQFFGCITTCPDRWMAFLGRGTPAVATPATLARSWVSPDGVRSLAVLDERGDTGFYNVAFDKATQTTRVMSYATAHGFQHNSGGHMSLFPPAKHFEWLRPFTAAGATAMGSQKFGRFLTQALDPVTPGRLSHSERWAEEWDWLPSQGAVPKGGLIAASGDARQGAQWWFVHTDGLYFSADGGAHLTQVMDPSAKPALIMGPAETP